MAKVGLNAHCPCGSRKKYKKCCLEKEGGQAPTPTAGGVSAASASIPFPGGFDFGCLPDAMAVGIYDFPAQLRNANIMGVAYGEAWSAELQRSVPMVSLVAQKSDPLIEAFSTFHSWAEASDPDALEMTFVFRKNGGYVLALGPEPLRLGRRCLGFDRVHRPLISLVTWFKPIESVQPILRELMEYKKEPISPFVVVCSQYPGNLPAFGASSAAHLQDIREIRPLLKFEATFVEESQVVPGTIAELAIRSTPNGARREHDPAESAPEILERRSSILRFHFPVTLERLRVSHKVARIAEELESEGIAAWQVEQAACNLILGEGMGCGTTYQGLAPGDVSERIVAELQARYEIADGRPLPEFGIEDVRAQIIADAATLLHHAGKQVPKDPLAIQSSLRSASLFEATTAVPDLVEAWISIK